MAEEIIEKIILFKKSIGDDSISVEDVSLKLGDSVKILQNLLFDAKRNILLVDEKLSILDFDFSLGKTLEPEIQAKIKNIHNLTEQMAKEMKEI